MLNKVMLIGRLGKDPELRYSNDGNPMVRFSLATDESYTDRNGTKVDRTEWHTIVGFQRTAENCANYLAKGSLVFIEGKLQTRKWQDQQGQDRYSTEIVAGRVQFLEKRNSSDQNQNQNANQAHSNGSRSHQAPAQSGYGNEDYGPAFPSDASGMDDIPF